MTRRLPDFIYIGTGKAGSTWMFATLARHTEIYLTEVKETNFFDLNYKRGLDWYANFFTAAGPDQKIGEIAHRYVRHAESAARINKDIGKIKFLVGLREAQSYFLSDYLFAKRNGKTALEAEDYADQKFDWSALKYRELIGPYVEEFGAESILICDFALLESDPQTYLDHITAFVGVSRMALDEEGRKAVNAASSARAPGIARMVNNASKWAKRRGGQRLIQAIKGNPVVMKVLYREIEKKPDLPKAVADRLKAAAADDLAWVDQTFGSDLAKTWYGRTK